MTAYGNTTCRDCNKPIFWADSKNGKPMPMDSEPIGKSALGRKSYVLSDPDSESAGESNTTAIFDARGVFDGEWHYTCHFDTCESRAK
jgi:hypothetical protein